MPDPSKSNRRSKAIVATAFALSVLVSDKAIAANDGLQALSITQQIASNKIDTPFTKAYKLLELADSYLINSDSKMAEHCVHRSIETWSPIDSGKRNIVALLSNRIASRQSGSNAHERQPSNNPSLAEDALLQAIKQIDLIPEPARKLNLSFIASMLFEETGDTARHEEYKKILDENLTDLSACSCSDEKQIGAAVFILNSMAYNFIPLAIGTPQKTVVRARIGFAQKWTEDAFAGPVDPRLFKDAEKLRLRGLALADQLDATNDVRRRAHRDMVMWYRALGKIELAEKEKQNLFGLVGFKDDNLLYPQSGACGSEIWWQPKIVETIVMFCGMG